MDLMKHKTPLEAALDTFSNGGHLARCGEAVGFLEPLKPDLAPLSLNPCRSKHQQLLARMNAIV